MSSVRHFYFFICINILFFISLQSDDENSEENPESSTNTSELTSKKCIKYSEDEKRVETEFIYSFEEVSTEECY